VEGVPLFEHEVWETAALKTRAGAVSGQQDPSAVTERRKSYTFAKREGARATKVQGVVSCVCHQGAEWLFKKGDALGLRSALYAATLALPIDGNIVAGQS